MSRLNGPNSIQHSTQGRGTRCRWWRIHDNCGVYISLSKRITRRRSLSCITCRRLDSRVFRTCFQLSSSLAKKGGTYRSYDMYGSNAGKSSNPKSKRIQWIKNRKEQAMGFGTTPMNLNKWANENSGKTHRSISDGSVQERTSLNRNSMKMRYRLNAMTWYPKKQIIELSKLKRGDTRISTPT